MLLYRPISCEGDFSLLQEDIDRISDWVNYNFYLQFNVQKCKLMYVSRKTQSPFTPCLRLHNQQLEMVSTYKYLGLLLSNDLSWSQHIKYLCSKARKILGLIYRRFYQFSSSESLLQMYLSLVRPNVEYASQVWSPYKIREVNSIESVQKFALRMCAKNWNAGYEQLLELFSLPDLQQRRLYLDLCSMFRIVHGMFYFPSAVFVRQDTHRFTRSSHHPSFVCPYARTCYYFNSFVPRTVRLWNTLPTPIVNNPSIVSNPTTSLYSFKSSLWAHMFY